MICFLCFLFTLLVSGFGICAVTLCIFSGIACNLFPLLGSMIEILFAVLCFGSEIMIYIISGFIEVIEALMRLCIYAAPFISRGFRHVYNSYPYVLNEAQHHFWNFINNQKETIIFCWSSVLVALYMLKDQVQGVFLGNRVNNQNADMNGQNIEDNDEDDEGDVNWRNRFNNVERNGRNRQGYHQRRLYPVLPVDDTDDDSDDDTDDDSDNGYVQVNNNQMDDSQCIVCFEHDRNTAVFPCGHTQLCEQCTRYIMTRNNRCPVCQRLIAEYRTIYL